jgi:hypothetical protein
MLQAVTTAWIWISWLNISKFDGNYYSQKLEFLFNLNEPIIQAISIECEKRFKILFIQLKFNAKRFI